MLFFLSLRRSIDKWGCWYFCLIWYEWNVSMRCWCFIHKKYYFYSVFLLKALLLGAQFIKFLVMLALVPFFICYLEIWRLVAKEGSLLMVDNLIMNLLHLVVRKYTRAHRSLWWNISWLTSWCSVQLSISPFLTLWAFWFMGCSIQYVAYLRMFFFC